MMPMYDYTDDQGHDLIDVFEPVVAPLRYCEQCKAPMRRVWLTKASAVLSDDIPGGILIKNGLCWPDGTPRKFYSKSELYREAERQGYVNRVEHKGTKGGDRSIHTTRWI